MEAPELRNPRLRAPQARRRRRGGWPGTAGSGSARRSRSAGPRASGGGRGCRQPRGPTPRP
eukprot:2139457-Alexandrium_andersonii.AAC.1